MNTAARLESANKQLGSSVMASREFAEASGLDWWRPMGRVQLRGRARPVDLYEPAPDFPAESRARLAEAMALAGHDAPGAIAIVNALCAGHKDDLALQKLAERLGRVDEGGTYVLS
jgi:adenylate cyclase